ncbi:hypothetical protein RclHR1_08360009 [Rhizophagus clarus]|uniref:Uncharacterized protein n=1 Tax=Rhizophagus clarus TaxID=94130 RepID=A0A2Z6S749_9GLOM|nr:hypothetical protein RclHR1_08360009 [Rhizophagus clarus]GET01462.1 hypothetical protein GLOIN_2v1672524 [Rhizophagus clarus]
MSSPDELAAQASCYGLPYGIFGISCWFITFFSASLVHVDCPIFAPWKWFGNKRYQVQGLCLTFTSSILILGPAIFTCLKCKSDWKMFLVALGQLTPWSFKIMNDGLKIEIDNQKNQKLGKFYIMAGLILTIPLSLVGWIGMTALSISLTKTEKDVSIWIWSLYLIALFTFILAFCKDNTTFLLLMTYIFSTLHIIGSHVIFALVSNNLSGLAPTGAGMASSIIFFLGKRSLFIDPTN